MTENPLDKFIRQAMTDADLRSRLTADPKATLASAGINIPDNLDVKIAEDTSETVWIHLPRSVGELSTEELDSVAGGYHHANFSGQWGTTSKTNLKRPDGGGATRQ